MAVGESDISVYEEHISFNIFWKILILDSFNQKGQASLADTGMNKKYLCGVTTLEFGAKEFGSQWIIIKCGYYIVFNMASHILIDVLETKIVWNLKSRKSIVFHFLFVDISAWQILSTFQGFWVNSSFYVIKAQCFPNSSVETHDTIVCE